MINLIRSEFRKLFTTQTWFWLLLGTIALTALQASIAAVNIDSARDLQRNAGVVFGASSNAFIFVLILGVLAVTGEFRNQTITPTLLATPSRFKVVLGKLITYAVLGVGYAIVSVVETIAIAAPILNGKDIGFSLSDNHIPRVLFSGLIVVALYGLFGLGIGALLKNQALGVTLGVLYPILIENLIFQAIPKVRAAYPFTPGGGATAMQITQDRHDVSEYYTILPPLGGFFVLLGWSLLFALVGTFVTMRKDIT